jgi:hypothetical protein
MSTPQVFQRTQETIVAALEQSLALHEKISPKQIRDHLHTNVLNELDLSRCGECPHHTWASLLPLTVV